MKKYMLAAVVTAASVCSLCAQTTPAEQQGPAIKVEKMVTAASVENKEPVNETLVFDKSAGKVFTWTKIAAERTPVKIKHVYYADGKKAAEVELSVNSTPYRVWSFKTVWPGSWKVEATDEAGAVLSSVEFTVSASAAPAEPEKPAASGK